MRTRQDNDETLIDIVRPLAAETIQALGLIEVAYLEEFTAYVSSLRNSDPREGAFKGTLRPFHVLTAAGAINPEQSIDISFSRAKSNLNRALQRDRDIKVLYRGDGGRSQFFPAAISHAAPNDPCQAAIAFDGALSADPPLFPLPGCDRDVCGCGWRLLTNRELNSGLDACSCATF